MGKLQLKNRWILVTGASSGLGREIACRLAEKEGANLILVARRGHLLEDLKRRFEDRASVKVQIIVADLGREDSPSEVFRVATADQRVFAVINNAGITSYQPTSKDYFDVYDEIFRVNFRSVMQLTLLFYVYFQEQGEGAILNITSAAAFMPIPFQNVYAASKHATQAFTEGLAGENRHRKVHISSFAPGGIATEMIIKAGLDKKYRINSVYYMTPEVVARRAIRCLKFKRHIKIPGVGNKILYTLTRVFSRKWVAKIASYLYRHPDVPRKKHF